MSLREIWQNLSVDTLLSLPPSELLALVILVILTLAIALSLIISVAGAR